MFAKPKQKVLLELTKRYLKESAEVLDIDSLREVLQFHEWKYYVQYDPVISDFEYDQLFSQLQDIEKEHPNLITNDSPTQRVASDITTNFTSVNHLSPMLSLGNSYNADDLRDFDTQIRKLTDTDAASHIVYSVEPKLDGGSVALVYDKNQLLRAATRGNGVAGEKMTSNAKTLPTVPLQAKFSELGIAKAELRGEAVIRKSNFDQINKEREEKGLSVFANPRNAAAGGLRMKNPNETRERGIEIFIFQMSYAINDQGDDILSENQSHFDQISSLSELGFKTPSRSRKKCKSIDEVINFVNQWELKRDDYPYEIDGMVIKLDDMLLQEKCGYTQHHPRWAIAYKFKAKQATTKLIGIEYQVGKIGSITPVAKLDPIQLAGVTISSVSLHNEEFISTKDLRLGDTVLVERAGDVIPYIVKSMSDLRDGSETIIEFPRQCPSCNSDLIKLEKEAAWRCINTTCEAQVLQKLIFHVSKDAMDIDGFGKSYIERFYQLGYIHDLTDIYNLDYDEISKLEGFGDRSATNLKSSISKAKENPIHRLLHSLSIHHLGKKASKIIAEQINHVLDLQQWTEEKFTDIKDIGPVVAENVAAYFSNPEHITLLQKLESYGVNLTQTEEDKPVEVADDAPLQGKTILFTGSLQNVGRKEAQELATKAGAKNISAVSGNLNILVVGEKAGSKLKKAEALGTVQIISEDEFLAILNS